MPIAMLGRLAGTVSARVESGFRLRSKGAGNRQVALTIQ